ncbi:MAG: hypothetical protein Q7S51_02685 [Gallionellaceae bacterium]|nr:hypothetical protein [Gallionellaceae bacterium]
MGYINATSSGGLSFYSASTFSAASEVTALQLNATSTSAGSGAVENTNDWTGSPVTTTFAFAYDADYFIRDNGTATQCFNRDPLQADESVWRYGLYDATTGEQITRNSGFPIEYTDTGTSTTYSGYIGYYGLWMPVTVPSGATVEQISYDTDPPTKTSYTLLETGGKLTRYTTGTKTLAALNKITFWYFAPYDTTGSPITIPVAGTASLTSMTSGSQYELYWDNTAQKFFVSGEQGSTGNMEPLATAGFVTNADMVTANPWGLSGWSEMAGGQFGISGNDFDALTTPTTAIPTPSDIPVLTQTANIVYPDQFASITGGLTCINDCPTAASIGSDQYVNPGWTPVASSVFVTYTLDSASGNLIDPAASSVVSTATSGVFASGVMSGRLVTPADATAMIAAKDAASMCAGSCTSFTQGDVDFLPAGSSYYIWETGANSWNKIALLMNGTTPVAFDPPLQVSFVVPTGTTYGNYAGATLSLQYGGFGDLWGIPNECIDVTTNEPCDFAPGGTAQNNQRWTSKFSIPFDTTTGVVTTTTASYLVKPLDKEVRLKEVVSCAGVSLSVPASGSVTLPAAGDFSNPTTTVGAEPTFTTVPAPQVIHGVKQY